MADINDKYVLYYAVRGYASGQVVTIDIYDTVGTKEVSAGSMTELSSGLGIYSFNWFPKKRTSYTAVMNCAAKPRQVHEIIRIEKTKLAGVTRFPAAPKQVFKEEDKKKLFSKLNKIPFESEEHTRGIKKMLEDIRTANASIEFKKIVPALSELKRDIISENKKQTAELSRPDISKDILSKIEKKSDTQNELLEKISKSISSLMVLTDDSNIISKLNIPDSEFKEKLKLLSKNMDEMILLTKVQAN